ncbi:MAG: hypothetical protein WBF53_13120 [Litorimonas sp.]
MTRGRRHTLAASVLAAVAVTAMTTGCATAATSSDTAAKLAAPAEAQLRDRIRTHVRDALGTDYMADPQTLSETGTMIARDRRIDAAMGRPKIPMPDVAFDLVLVGTGAERLCELRSTADDVAVLELDEALCVER